MSKPAQRIQRALNELLAANPKTAGLVAGQMYLQTNFFGVKLDRVIEAEHGTVIKTIDVVDLIKAHQEENK